MGNVDYYNLQTAKPPGRKEWTLGNIDFENFSYIVQQVITKEILLAGGRILLAENSSDFKMFKT